MSKQWDHLPCDASNPPRPVPELAAEVNEQGVFQDFFTIVASLVCLYPSSVAPLKGRSLQVS
jgi:hypothetical protein